MLYNVKQDIHTHQPKVGVVIQNYNNWADTLECLERVVRNDYPNYFITVIDNGSNNNSIGMILS